VFFDRRDAARRRPSVAQWSVPDTHPLPPDVLARLRAEQVPLSRILSILVRCSALGIRVVAQTIGGEICRLWACPGNPTDFVECERNAPRPVAEALERLLDALARAQISV
jgi:hypothetical protein